MDLKTSGLWALLACLVSLGTILTPWYTLSSRVSIPEVSRHDECLFQGPNWKCIARNLDHPAMDPGATSWQEIPAHFYYNKNLNSEKPLWNPYIGSGYPIFLDGISRSTSPLRSFLNHFPSDKARDFLIFFRDFIWTWGLLFAVIQLGLRGRFLFFVGIAGTLLPYLARYVDIAFLDVDLMAPWIFALSIPWFKGEKLGRSYLAAFAFLGFWIGLQSFVQSQIIFASVFGLNCLFFMKHSKKESTLALIAFSLPFLAASLPYVLEFKEFFPELYSNRIYLGCTSDKGTGLSYMWYYGYVGYLKNTELGTVFSLLGFPICVWGAVKERRLRVALCFYLFLFVWMTFGSPSVVCKVDGLNGIHVSRHLVPYLQSLFLILVSCSLYFLVEKKRHRNLWLGLGFILFIFPALNRQIVSVQHLKGKYPRAVEFHPDPIDESNVYSKVQKLSLQEDRRHFAPDWRMYPNYSSIFQILDLRVLYGVLPLRVFRLNDSLFHQWHETPSYGHADRFVGPDMALKMIPPDLEKVLVLHRVSLLTFSKNHNWIEKGQIYNPQTCMLRGQDELAAFYFCPILQGVGFFPKEVIMSSGIDQSLEILKKKSASELVDFAVIEDSSAQMGKAAQGTVSSFERRPNRLVYNLEVGHEGYFVVADSYFAGWSAEVNGQKAEILPANVGFKAVYVPRGTVKLEMDYNGKLSH